MDDFAERPTGKYSAYALVHTSILKKEIAAVADKLLT